MSDQTTETTVEKTETPAEAPQLSLNDLSSIANIIKESSKRGTWQAEEMSSVGAVYDKLSAFLAHVAAQQAPAEDAEATDETAE